MKKILCSLLIIASSLTIACNNSDVEQMQKLIDAKDKKIEESIIDDNDDFIKTTLYLTATQRSKIEKASIRHGWTISRECRFRIQTTLDNNLDFYDQELLMLNRCRNVVDKIGRNFHLLLK